MNFKSWSPNPSITSPDSTFRHHGYYITEGGDLGPMVDAWMQYDQRTGKDYLQVRVIDLPRSRPGVGPPQYNHTEVYKGSFSRAAVIPHVERIAAGLVRQNRASMWGVR